MENLSYSRQSVKGIEILISLGEFEGGDYIKRKIMVGVLILTILSLIGCGTIPREANEKTEVKIEDVIITNPDTTYYTIREGVPFSCDDTILICGYNEYRCINTSMEYNEEYGKYTCVIEFKKIVDND